MMYVWPAQTWAGPGSARLWVDFICFFSLSLPSIDTETQICAYESVCSHKDVPNVFFKDVYFVRAGACGSLFIGTLHFVMGVKHAEWRAESFICMVSLVCESFVTQSKRSRLFSFIVVLFVSCLWKRDKLLSSGSVFTERGLQRPCDELTLM